MKTKTPCYQRHRFPSQIISHAVWLYHRFGLSFCEVEELLAERGVIVIFETIRRWWQKFGPDYGRKLKKRQGRLGDMWHVDEVFVTIQGQRYYCYRAVDLDVVVIDILLQRRRNQKSELTVTIVSKSLMNPYANKNFTCAALPQRNSTTVFDLHGSSTSICRSKSCYPIRYTQYLFLIQTRLILPEDLFFYF